MNPLIHIDQLEDGQVQISCGNVPFPELVRLCLMVIDIAGNKVLEMAETPDLRDQIAADMHELINIGASSLLDKMFPEIEMRPDLTVEAIARAQDDIINNDPEFVKKAGDAFKNSVDYAIAEDERKKIKKNLQEQNKQILNIADHKKPKRR